ncbi:hypothetical protein ACX93W_21655 [Paenibacillus sp. CAU 1782]
MTLSKRALEYLEKCEWKSSVKDEKEILETFEAIKIQPTLALMDFQKRFGGYVEYAYLEPITFGILQKDPCRGDFLNEKGLIIIEPEDDIIVRHYVCADTLYQETFSIDERGRYYLGYELQCNNFDTHIEEAAILKELNKEKWDAVFEYELDMRTRNTYDIIDDYQYTELCKYFGLKKLEGFPEDIISFDKNDTYLVWRRSNSLKVLSKKGIGNSDLEALNKVFCKS